MNKLDLSDVSQRTFANMLKRQAEENGATPYLVNDKSSISFAEAENISNRLANGLKAAGLAAGDRIALLIGNKPEMVLLAIAANKIGAIWTPINTEYKGDWLADNIQRCRAKILVVDAALYPRLQVLPDNALAGLSIFALADEQADFPAAARSYDELLSSPPLVPDYSKQDYGDTCAILWTSGTTGKSKGVMQSYNAWIRAIVRGASVQYNSTEGDVIYCTLPLYNSGAWITSILRGLIEGLPVVIEQKFSVSNFWQRVEQFGATQTFILGAMGVFLLNAEPKQEDASNSMRTMQIVPFPPPMWQPFEERFDLRLLRTGLGQSECLLVLTQQPGDPEDIPVYALGFAIDDTEVCLMDDNGKPVAAGEVGEICVKPLQPHIVFNGYFDAPEATEAAYFGEWYRTGDLGRKDPETGAYFYSDRKKDAVRFGGRNISTLEVESVVLRHPAVAEAAAFGIPSEQLDSEDELKIDIVLQEGQDVRHEEICAFINENAPHFFVPRYMEFVESLPYTPTNKVQKFKLRSKGISGETWDLKSSGYKVIR
jgi:crotonobetaine/carnitine-CoA ligase